jgi:hypothetical protein
MENVGTPITIFKTVADYQLELSVVKNEGEIKLMLSLVDWGGGTIHFLTDCRFLAVNRRVLENEIKHLSEILCDRYSDVYLGDDYNAGIYKYFALFDLEKVWEELGYEPTRDVTFFQYGEEIRNWER